MKHRTILILLSLSFALAGCAAGGTLPRVARVELLGEYIVPHTLRLEGTPVGGLSSIDAGPDGEWILLSDDRSRLAPARFYRARITLSEAGIENVTFTGATTILRADGTSFPPASVGTRDVPDPEAIRYDPRTGTLLWTSEGDRMFGIEPFIREMRINGSFLREIPLHTMFTVRDSTTGVGNNGVFEGMTLTPDGAVIEVALEQPLMQDGPAIDSRARAPVRISFIDRASGALLRQIAYLPEFAPKPIPPSAEHDNGVVEILELDADRLLVLERAYAPGVGNVVRLFEADHSRASDVSKLGSLAGAQFHRAVKRLVADLGAVALTHVDNFEGMAWGPTLANGDRTLLLVSDNNFNPEQVTMIVALRIGGL